MTQIDNTIKPVVIANEPSHTASLEDRELEPDELLDPRDHADTITVKNDE